MKAYIKIVTSIVVLMVAFGCQDYLDVNKNPNVPTNPNLDLGLAGVLISAANDVSTNSNQITGQWNGMISVSGTFSNSGDVIRTYNITTLIGSGLWSQYYYQLSSIQSLEKLAKKPGFEKYLVICKVMKAYYAQILVDMYNNVPYSSALKGFNGLLPSYDKAEDVYEQASIQLDSAVIIGKAALANPIKPITVPKYADIMLDGDIAKWMKLANTIRLRILIRQSNVSSRAGYVTAEIAKIVANGQGYLAVDAKINPGYEKTTGKQSPMWEAYGLSVADAQEGRGYLRASQYAFGFFKGQGDLRLGYIFRAINTEADHAFDFSDTTKINTIPFGAAPVEELTTAKTSSWGTGILKSASQDVIFFSASQSLFLQAEAVQRGWIPGVAQTLYESGITESFKTLGVQDAVTSATNYYSQNRANINWNLIAADKKLEAIAQQKWMAIYMQDCIEGWSEVRRLGIPDAPLSVDPSKLGGGKAPARLLYPQSEYNTNASEVGKQGSINIFSSKIFWDID
jgi:Starch-binding associating with outer membrane